LSENLCRNCGGKLRFIEATKKWICDNCQTSYGDIPAPLTATPTLRYSTTHEALTIVGLGLVLAAEGLSFLAGLITGSTLLYLQRNEIEAYETVARTIERLTAPYQFLDHVAIVLELLIIGLVISSAATLRSFSRKRLHRIATFSAPLVMVAHFAIMYVYDSLTKKALSELPSTVPSQQLVVATEVQQRFDTAYGFWGGPAYAIVIFFSWIALFALVGAALTPRALQPTLQPLVISAPQESPLKTPIAHPSVPTSPVTSATVVLATKFCRQCGAKILRDSKYCEECGTRLV